jgi:hypothetical protein
MADAINHWFRWHHGSVNDPKFGLVAKRADARVGDVIAVWALVLELASANHDRGAIGDIDHEATDFLLGAEDGTTARILVAMEDRGLLHGGGVVRWEVRQPKRERVDSNAAERKRQQRGRAIDDGESGDVTPCHATSRHVTPREEERREEKSKQAKSKTTATAAPSFDPGPAFEAHGVQPQTAADWLAMRKSKRAPVTPTVLKTLLAEAAKAGMSLDGVLAICCTRGWVGFEAAWVLNAARAGPGGQYQTANEKAKDLADRLTGKKHAEPRHITDIN